MKSQYKPIIILSAFKTGVTQSNNCKNHLTLGTAFDKAGISYRRCVGVYCGSKEPSFIIDNTPDNLEVALKCAYEFSQESILVMDNEGRGKLVYTKGPKTSKQIGFIKVTDSKPNGDYTQVNDTNEYFTFN